MNEQQASIEILSDTTNLNEEVVIPASDIPSEQDAIDAAELAAVNEATDKKMQEVLSEKSAIPGPNLAPTDTKGNETAIPVPGNVNDGQVAGGPTTPSLSRGNVLGTTLDEMNNSLSHVCDFSLEVQKNNALRKFLVAQAKNIRDGVRAVMRALGLSDATGQFQWIKDKLQAITRELKWIQKNIIQPILDFQKYVIDYIKKIQAIIAWIMSLPAKLIALLKDCLAKLYKLISNLMTAVASDLAEGGNGETGFSDVVKAAKETVSTAVQTASQAAKAYAGTVSITTVATNLPSLVSPLKKGI